MRLLNLTTSSKWPTLRLGEAIELVYGKSLPKNVRVEGTIPVYGSNGIAGWHNTPSVNGPTIIVGRKGSAGAVQLVEEPCCPIDTTYFVRVREGFRFELRFLFYLLRKLDLSRLKTATGVPGLTREDAYQEQIPVPPFDEQRRIVDILSRAEGIIRLRREAQKKAAELIPALFLDMFGDPAMNPKGRPIFRLGDIAEVVSGVTKGRKFNGKQTVTAPYLRVANVQAGFLDLTELKEIEVLPSDVQQLTLQYGDVLLTEGGDYDKLGRGALWIYDIPRCIHQNHIFRVRLEKDFALPEFFVTYLQTQHARNYFLRSAKQTTNLASINMTQLRGLPVILPPVDTQSTFVKLFEQIHSIKTEQENATQKAEATFNALLARAFLMQ
ncbi:MAG: restriction endonuclease subunit S [Syntrophobacteraceae bacterium]